MSRIRNPNATSFGVGFSGLLYDPSEGQPCLVDFGYGTEKSDHPVICDNIRSDHRLGRFARRRAAAPVEFVFFLPILCLLMVGMVAATAFIFRVYEAAMSSRQDVWTVRNVEWSNAKDVNAGSGLGRLARSKPFTGLAESELTEFQPLPSYISDQAARITDRQRLIQGPWDFRSISFPERDRLQVARHFGVHDNGAGRQALQSLARTLRNAGE